MQMLFGYARLAINFCYPAIIPLFHSNSRHSVES